MKVISTGKFVDYCLFPVGTYLLAAIAASLWVHEIIFRASIGLVLLLVFTYEHGIKDSDWEQRN